jgi:hypothetical protein
MVKWRTERIEHNTCIARETILLYWQKIAERGWLNARWIKTIVIWKRPK